MTILAISATPAAAAILWMRAHPQPPAPTIPVHSVVWADRVFMSRAELRRWLRGHGERYTTWARKHPTQAAELEHRPLPSKRAAVRKAAPVKSPSQRDTSSGPDAAFLALLLALAGTALVTLRARRRLRVPRPQVTLPAVDARSVAQGFAHRVARLGQRRSPTATPAPSPRAQATAPIGLSDRAIAVSPQPAGYGSLDAAPRVLDPSPALSLEPAGNGAIASATPFAGHAVAAAPEPAGNGSLGDPVTGSLAEAEPISEEVAFTSQPVGNGSVGDAAYPSDQSVVPLHPVAGSVGGKAPDARPEDRVVFGAPGRNGLPEEVPSVSDESVEMSPEPSDEGVFGDAAPEDEPTPPQPAGEGSPGDAARGRPRSLPAASARKQRRAAPKPTAPTAEPEASALADVRPIGTDADAGAIVPPVLPQADAVSTTEWELCTTACWRGYLSARFYAHPPGEGAVIKESLPFDWWAWQPDPKDRDAAQAALDEICDLLQAEGWEPFARGDAWYEVRFRRRPRMEW